VARALVTVSATPREEVLETAVTSGVLPGIADA
jgi:hypothetical protein